MIFNPSWSAATCCRPPIPADPQKMRFLSEGSARAGPSHRTPGGFYSGRGEITSTLVLFSPAKINLFLRILGKRPDGYHELASLFQTINLGDTLTFKLAKEDSFTCSGSDTTLPHDASNLVIRALNLFRRKTGLHFSINIHLEKKIPMQAGLGGGSSNAATTLWALNALHNKPYTEEELQIWSAEIGSDIPFFFSHGTAYCTGRGEKVRDLPILTLPPLTLFKPASGLSTPAVYQALLLKRCSKHDPEKLLENFYKERPHFLNDLEEPAFRLLPILQHYKRAVPHSTMTGSGTAFFCKKLKMGEELPFYEIISINRPSSEWYII